MDGKTLRDKLVGSEDERAVSPVIGVILMVAITVILAAVIATLVMDFGDSTESPINAVVETDQMNSTHVELTVTEAGSAQEFQIRGAGASHSGALDGGNFNATGETFIVEKGSELSSTSGETVNIIAIDGDKEENAGSFEVP